MQNFGSPIDSQIHHFYGRPEDSRDRGIIGDAKNKVSEEIDKAGGEIGQLVNPDLYHEKIDISLTDPSYKNISVDDAARMMGYFTQKMQGQNFPWALYEVKEGKIRHKSEISDMDALMRLKKGQDVLFQPRRNLQLDLSSDSLTAVSKLGGDPLKKVSDLAALSKDGKVAPSVGLEVGYGVPVVIRSFGELKLLHEMYNPEVAVAEQNSLGKAAHNLSFFTKKTQGTTYPWRFVREGEGNVVTRAFRSAISKGIPGLLIGAGVGLMIGGPIGLFTGAWATAYTLATYGAAIGGTLMAAEGARSAMKGEEINAFETLARVTDDKPVSFQERKAHSIGLPILGTFTWYSDHGKGSVISSTEELELYYRMNDQDAPAATAAAAPAAAPADTEAGLVYEESSTLRYEETTKKRIIAKES